MDPAHCLPRFAFIRGIASFSKAYKRGRTLSHYRHRIDVFFMLLKGFRHGRPALQSCGDHDGSRTVGELFALSGAPYEYRRQSSDTT